MCSYGKWPFFLIILHLANLDMGTKEDVKTSYVMCFFYVQWFEVRGNRSFCWFWWNCWPSLFKLSFHSNVFPWQNIICTSLYIQSKTLCEHHVYDNRWGEHPFVETELEMNSIICSSVKNRKLKPLGKSSFLYITRNIQPNWNFHECLCIVM